MQDPVSLDRIRRGPLRDLVCDQLVESIVSGRLPIGFRLVEGDLAAELGTSRLPVREALLALHKDGWVDLLPRRGARVHVPVDGEVDEMFGVRVALESESARLAAQRATDVGVKALRSQVRAGTRLVRADEYVAGARANSVFHRSVADMSGNELLGSLLVKFDDRVRWYFGQVADDRGLSSWKEHAAIVDAIAAGDADRAAAVMRVHIEATRQALNARASAAAAAAG